MEKLRKMVNEIAYAEDNAKLSSLQCSLIPLLSFASSLYSIALSSRSILYRFGFFSRHRLPVPVISVGNLTWGGNGKTPMVESLARWLADSRLSPLILTRGYAGGDEAKMLERHLLGTSAKIGVGANRAATAASFFEKYGYIDPRSSTCSERICLNLKVASHLNSEKTCAVILDDGMQHWRLCRDVEIVMINGLMPWGNRRLLPLGPLRESLKALKRADIAVVHHADLISELKLQDIESTMREVKVSLPIFFTRMSPSYFFEVGNVNSIIPLGATCNAIVLCVSAIGSANSFVQGVEKIGALYVDRLDFSDHHLFTVMDIEMIRTRLKELEGSFGSKPIVVVTEKDYDRAPDIFKHLYPFEVLALCSHLQIIPHKGCTEEIFKKLFMQIIGVRL